MSDRERSEKPDVDTLLHIFRDRRISLLRNTKIRVFSGSVSVIIQGGSNMTGTDLYVNKPHCAAAVRP